MKITVLGVGAWGTTLAKLLHEGGHKMTLWAHNSDRLDEIKTTRRNSRYLPDVELPENWKVEKDLNKAVKRADVVVVAVASKAFRKVLSGVSGYDGTIVTCTKGIEFDSGLTMSGVIEELHPDASIAALSGPTLALEVAKDVPAAIVAASQSQETADLVQGLFHRSSFRVYTSTDLLGVELGGALKNVIAIAAGVCDGLGFGDNSKAALVTRGILEMQRLGVACGADADTFQGLGGLGDLVATCFSRLSRNRKFGERLGSGEQLTHILLDTPNVAEGYPAACSARQLAQKKGISTPIINEVYSMLYDAKDPAETVGALMTRESKPE